MNKIRKQSFISKSSLHAEVLAQTIVGNDKIIADYLIRYI